MTTRTASAALLRGELVDARLGDERAPADDDEPLGGERHLGDEVARDEHGAALGGQVAQQVADPADALGVEPVDRLVEEQHAGVAEQGAGDAEALAHAERELAGPLVGDRGQPDDVEHLVDARRGDVVRLGQPREVVAGGAAGVERLGVEERADLAQRPAQLVVEAGR